MPVQVRFSASGAVTFVAALFFSISGFSMIAVFVNCIAVIAGSLIGIAIAGRFSKNMENVIQFGAGIVVLVLGIKMAFEFENIIYFTLAVILGGIAGTLLDIDGKIFKLGKLLERLVAKKNQNDGASGDVLAENLQVKSKFAYGFLNSSVLFCVGAMAILGSFKAGIEKDYSIIFTKSILDGFMAVSFAAAMGIGTAFSAIMILLYQGALTLLSTVVEPYCSQVMIRELTGSGGALIMMIGLNLTGLKSIKTANYLPAVLFTVLFVLLDPFIKGLF